MCAYPLSQTRFVACSRGVRCMQHRNASWPACYPQVVDNFVDNYVNMPANLAFAGKRYSVSTGGALNSGLGMIRTERTRGQSESAGVGVRIAVYPRSGEPEVTEVAAANPGSATAKFTRLVMDEVRAAGGKVPEESVREVVENLVHADYRGVVISVLDGGNVVRVSDKGPGVQHKRPGDGVRLLRAPRRRRCARSGASARGLASPGAEAEKVGGTVTIEDNIGGGTVATISVTGDADSRKEREPSAAGAALP